MTITPYRISLCAIIIYLLKVPNDPGKVNYTLMYNVLRYKWHNKIMVKYV